MNIKHGVEDFKVSEKIYDLNVIYNHLLGMFWNTKLLSHLVIGEWHMIEVQKKLEVNKKRKSP